MSIVLLFIILSIIVAIIFPPSLGKMLVFKV
ncbi:putative membrane protein [Clostridium bornimense]|uniref:Putative membrane protein n=1 Tax=Clostridium bornimense TaxID=1216932 RepID=W6RUS7_9CLOT|nr:putative membrane protein [Clostridium bornimense]